MTQYSRIREFGYDKRTGSGNGFSLWVDEAPRIFTWRGAGGILAEMRKYRGQPD